MASGINGVGKLLTESDGVQQPKTQPVEGFVHRLIKRRMKAANGPEC